ncbi:MAG: hypothetical protein NZ933_00500 [Bacteroidia bacterium]|nr:hypothetical protein [Bacteroidia bacterium]
MQRFPFIGLIVILLAQEAPVGFGLVLRGHSGVAIGSFGKLREDLKAANALGKDFRIIPWATTAGGSFDLLFGGRVPLGGAIQLQHYDASETERGLARPYALHYGGQVGFALVNKNLWLFYPYVGYQVGSYQVRYTNYFTEPIFFGNNQELRPLQKRTFSSQLGLAEIALALRRWKREQGITLVWGVDVGGFFSPSKGSWKASEGPNPTGVSPAQLSGGYLRFSLGVGYVKPKSEASAAPPPPEPSEEKPKKKRKKSEEPEQEPEQKKVEDKTQPQPPPSTMPTEKPEEDKKKRKKKEKETKETKIESAQPTVSPEKPQKESKKKKKSDEEDED